MKGFIKLADGIYVNPDKKQAQTQMRFQIPTQETSEEIKNVLNAASLWHFGNPKNSVQDQVPVPTEKPTLTDDRYVYATFRALSQTFLPNRGLDFSQPGVLETAVNLLKNKTVYPNHDFTDIYNWLGVVSNSFWDAKGEKSNGVPGINCEIKIDAFLNYRIACGVMMNPPAINSMSLTVLFEFEYSHPQLVEEHRFWNLLGEEVDGQIVRLIVTKIIDFWEASLVFLGEDRMAKHHGCHTGDDPQDESFSAASFAVEDDIDFIDRMIPHHQAAIKMVKTMSPKFEHDELKKLGENIVKTQSAEIEQMAKWKKQWSKKDDKKDDKKDKDGMQDMSAASFTALPTNSNQEKTMKLTKEQKAQLGIEFDGEDVPESEIFKAAETLAAKVTSLQPANIAALTAQGVLAEKLLNEKREEVTRLARLAELGAEEGELDEVISEQIKEAGFERLQGLHKYFEKKAADRFPQNGRSSAENSADIEKAGGVNAGAKKPAVKIGGLV